MEEEIKKFFAARTACMTRDHHSVRNYVVAQIPRHQGVPLGPEGMSEALGVPLERLNAILGDLERNLFFLVRDRAGAVNWAFPVTTDRTPHRVRFPAGEQAFAA